MQRQLGSAVVEFALVLPLVLIVVLGLVQVGLVVRDRLLVEEAARPGAAALQDDPAAIASAALAAGAGLDAGLIQVATLRDGSRGDPVTVRITYDEPFRVPLVGWLVGSGVSMNASGVERQEFG